MVARMAVQRSLFVLAVVSACTRPNPDICCVTALECEQLGASEPLPCELGVCVARACQTSGCDDDGDCPSDFPACVAGTCMQCGGDEAVLGANAVMRGERLRGVF
jgi:hypothetical protein